MEENQEHRLIISDFFTKPQLGSESTTHADFVTIDISKACKEEPKVCKEEEEKCKEEPKVCKEEKEKCKEEEAIVEEHKEELNELPIVEETKECECHKGSTAMTYYAQLLIILIVVFFSVINLTISSSNREMWASLLSACVGYILPAPTLEKKSKDK
jgi:hypothetical protein